ncbi:MAG: ATP synthase F1 subunit epsilon [Candidatus Doudnabacteria bacterium]|nr:ATP synthase F1 subunit epsilon [Candidatus Doudnabacteria bacterium]
MINFQLVTPERTVLSQELTSLSCPTTLGQITILPNHIPLVATLTPGELHAKTEKEDFFLHVSGGFVEVKQGSEVVVLADAAEHFHEIDLKRAEEARTRAEAAMKKIQLSEEEYAKVAASLERSLARTKIQRRHAHKKTPITGEGVFNE